MKGIYRIIEDHCDDDVRRIRIRLDASHPVYGAHFPGHPITPGAIIFQICEDLLPEGKSVATIKNVKFLHPHEPVGHPEVDITMSCLGDACQFVISDETTLFARINLITTNR